jgi:hypothetical protein
VTAGPAGTTQPAAAAIQATGCTATDHASNHGAAGLAASDDSQRMILLCVLWDACEWHTEIVSACTQCLAAGFTCDAHWPGYEETAEAYRDLRIRLESYSGLPVGTACPIPTAYRHTLTEALATAIIYRHDRNAAEDAALIAAYQQLRHRLAAESIPA